MGNLFGKRRNYNLKEIPETKNKLEFNDVSKADEHEIPQTVNNLELYLNDVYEKECKIKASQEEVEFIQTGIETLVQDIVNQVLDRFSMKVTEIKLLNDPDRIKKIKNYCQKSLIDIYFPIKEGSGFENLNIKPTRSSIIKVGSFYEGTKNHFPDEFDFIFLLFSGRKEFDFSAWLDMKLAIRVCFSELTDKKSFHFSSRDGRSEIYLNTEETAKMHGPAYTLQFIYKDSLGKKRYIAADLVPAYKTVAMDMPDWFVRHVEKNVKPKSFRDEVLSAESCLNVGSHNTISFTETEVSFIRDILSKHHVKVYRILKFLINGHGDGDKTRKNYWLEREFIQYRNKEYSSYMIKKMMIYHHDECRNSDTTDLGPCVLQVLEEMCKYKDRKEYPAFFRYKQLGIRHCLVYQLQSVINSLQAMQTRTHVYSYENNKIKSVTIQYLELWEKKSSYINVHL